MVKKATLTVNGKMEIFIFSVDIAKSINIGEIYHNATTGAAYRIKEKTYMEGSNGIVLILEANIIFD